MLNIPDEVKGLFKLDRCNKNFRVHFPNGEMDDLTNENVVQESVEFSESICSQNTFKFGKSESSTIEFETVGVQNMMGMKIECGIEVDCSSLGADWIARHPVDDTLPFLAPQTAVASAGADQTLVENGEIVSVYNDGFDTLEDMEVALTPIQDLHGYSKPWPAGGGVNLLPPMVDGTYEGNGVKAVVVNGVATLSGTTTASGNAFIVPLAESFTVPSGCYYHLGNSVANGSLAPAIENGNNTSENINYSCSPANRISPELSSKVGQTWTRIRFYIGNGVTISGTYAPMMCLDNTARDFSPYSNICPITGRTGLNVWDDPKYRWTIDFNQKFPPRTLNYTGTNYTITSANDGKYVITTTATITETGANHTYIYATTFTEGHVYALLGSKDGIRIRLKGYSKSSDTIFKASSALYNNVTFVFSNVAAGTYDVYPMLFDLTQMFGATKAEEILALENGNTGDGVAWVKNLFPKEYYAYNTGTTTCVSAVNGDPYWKKDIDWASQAGTVYAGSIDIVSGALKARPRYASYNGETLTGPWMSSLDEYAAGATPTTGAEVVDLGGTETTYQLTAQDIVLLPAQNYLWASNSGMIRAEFKKSAKRMYYRVPYGRFTVRECPRDHQAMTHRKVTAYTDTRFMVTEYQRMLFDAKGFEKKYTPKFQNMFYAIVGMNNEPMILSAGYTKTAHDAFSSVSDSHQDDIIQFNVSGASKYFKLQVYTKVFTIGDSSQGAYTTDALYGIEGIENVDVSNLVEPIAKVLVDDYGVSEAKAYDYSTYDLWKQWPLDPAYSERYCWATVTKPKVIGFKARKDLSGGSYFDYNGSQYVDLTGMSGLYCINPDREGFITTVSVLAGITLTPWSSYDPMNGHAIGDPISTYGSGFDEAFLNQYTTPSGSAFDTELKLDSTGSEKTNVAVAPKVYWFTGAVDISKLMMDYLEVSALFAAQNRTGGLRVFSLDNSVLKEQLSAGEYSEFWWDEYDVSPIGKIKYILTKKEEEEETTYTFGSGQSVYDLTQNEFFKQFKKSKSEIETFLDVSFIPKLGAVAFTPIELTVGNGLPYIEAGDYIQATSEDGVAAKSFALTHTISGIQHLTETIESSGGDLVNSVFSEGN